MVIKGKPTEKQCLIVIRLKRWKRKECKPNSLPVIHKMHVKVGDTVKVIFGHEKGKIGEITKVFKHNITAVVKEINLKIKHIKSREEGEPGQIIKMVLLLQKDSKLRESIKIEPENGFNQIYAIFTPFRRPQIQLLLIFT